MARKPRTYYRDESDSDVSGILVVEDDGDHIRVTENRTDGWCAPFLMPEGDFPDDVSKVGLLKDDKFESVMATTKRKV